MTVRQVTEQMKRLAFSVLSPDLTKLLLAAFLIGLFVGLVAVGFLLAIEGAQWAFFGTTAEFLANEISNRPAWLIVAAPAGAGLLVGWLTWRWMPGSRPQSAGDAIEANALRGGHMSSRLGLKSALLAVLSIGGGASVGREGPMIHFGASIGAWIGRRFHISRQTLRVLLGCGVAAGVAASFNAPIAGSLIALELVIGYLAVRAFAPVVVSAVTATLISRAIFDHEDIFSAMTLSIQSRLEFPAFLLLGVLCGLIAFAFIRTTFMLQRWRAVIPVLPVWSHTALAGAAVGIAALWLPEILGVGYLTIVEALRGGLSVDQAALLLLAKFAATALCLAFGFTGGVFSPALFLGALTGILFGTLAVGASPVMASSLPVYSIVGMGALGAAVFGAPISTTLMIFELTGNYDVALGGMLSAIAATLALRRCGYRSFLLASLRARGVMISGGHDVGFLRTRGLAQFADRKVSKVLPDAGISECRDALLASAWAQLLVVEHDRLVGVITHDSFTRAQCDDPQTALELACQPVVIGRDETLQDAFMRFEGQSESHLPLVDSLESMKLIGLIHEHDVNLVYLRELERQSGVIRDRDGADA